MEDSKLTKLEENKNNIEIINCHYCHKKLKLMSFTCKCQNIFCLKHMNPIDHQCQYNYKLEHQKLIIEKNPVILPKKI